MSETKKSNNKIVEFTLSKDDKEYSCIVEVDFKRIVQATAVLSSTTLKPGSKGVNIELDYLGAGDKILFMCWKEGDEEIKEDFDLRMAACNYLGRWVEDVNLKSNVTVTEKKS